MYITTGDDAKANTKIYYQISILICSIIIVISAGFIWGIKHFNVQDLYQKEILIHQNLDNSIQTILTQNYINTTEKNLSTTEHKINALLQFCDQLTFLPTKPSCFIWDGNKLLAQSTTQAPQLIPESFDQINSFSYKIISLGQSVLLSSLHTTKNNLTQTLKVTLQTDISNEIALITKRTYFLIIISLIIQSILVAILIFIAYKWNIQINDSHKDQAALENALFFLSHYDTLTHLPNRTLFWERLDNALTRATRLGKAVGILVLDIKGFTAFNNQFGRSVGDKMLIETARRLQVSSRANDLVCRIGADEFCILLEDLEIEQVQSAGKRLISTLDTHFQKPWADDNLQAQIIIQIGFATYPPAAPKSDDLLKIAFENMNKK